MHFASLKTVTALAVTVLLMAALSAVFAGSALASSPPTNTALPAVSPSQPYLGKTLTASTGTWSSEATTHWFSCDKAEGGTYNSSACAVVGSPSEWKLSELSSGKATSVTATNGQTPKVTIAGTIAGSPGTITCSKTVTSTSLENPTGGGAGTGGGEITYSSCTTTGWGTCTVTPGAAVPVSFELITAGTETKVKILPTGATLGSFTLSGEKCIVAPTTVKLVGEINGRYSSINSQIEFTTETTATGLRFGSKFGPVATASGTIGLQSATGGYIKASPISSYAYAWNRCEGKTCSAISGANGPTYVPVIADLGKSLSVTVTATDPNGSTAATSAATSTVKQAESEGRLSFFQCGKWGGTSYYDNASCSHTGETNSYSWLRPASASFVTEAESKFVLDYTAMGTHFEIECNPAQGEGTLTNAATRAEVSGYQLTFSGCYLKAPTYCTINGSGTIKFKPLSATSPAAPEALQAKLKFVPQEGTTFAEFEYGSCALAGYHKIVGSWPATVDNATSRLISTSAESKSTLRLDSASGPEMGAQYTGKIVSEGGLPVKLDIAP